MSRQRWLMAVSLFVLSFLIRYWALQQTSYANGWDAYFYLIQLKAWLEEGSMHSSDLSLIYPYFLLLKAFIPDYITAFKSGAALLAGGFSLMLFLVSHKLSGRLWIALLAGSLSLFSPELTYFAAQYPKNLLGLILLLALIATADNWKLALLFLILGFFGHRMTALLGVIYLTAFYISQYKQWKLAGYAAGMLILLLAVGMLLPGLISLYDLERFSGELTALPQLAWLSFQHSLQEASFSWFWKLELWGSLLFFGVGLITLVKRRGEVPPFQAALLLMLSVLVFPFLRWSAEGFAFRFIQVFLLLSPLLLLFLTRKLPGIALQGACGMLVVLSFFSWKSYRPDKHDPPYSLYNHISRKASGILSDRNAKLLIAHKSLAEFYTFSFGLDALPWEPEYQLPEGALWRIAAGIPVKELSFATASQHPVYELGFGYVLLEEKAWEQAIRFWEKQEDEHLLTEAISWQNPHQIRPAYLLKNK